VAVLVGLRSGYGGKRAGLWAILAGLMVNAITMVAYPITALMTADPNLAVFEALGLVLAGEAPSIDGYFLYSVVGGVIGYVAGAEADKRALAAEH
jgi:hypothetical protein